MRGRMNFQPGPPADEVDFARGPHPSKYDDLIEAVCAMRPGTTIFVDLEEDDTVESRRLCIRQALNRYLPDGVTAKKRFEVRKTEDDCVAIVCYRQRRR